MQSFGKAGNNIGGHALSQVPFNGSDGRLGMHFPKASQASMRFFMPPEMAA